MGSIDQGDLIGTQVLNEMSSCCFSDLARTHDQNGLGCRLGYVIFYILYRCERNRYGAFRKEVWFLICLET